MSPSILVNKCPLTDDISHINGLDKTPEGDYLISARHTSTIYKVSAQNGSILWTLGGSHSSWSQNFNFSSQHNIRFLSENSTTTMISIFDNASNGFNKTADFSLGKVIALDNSTMTATLMQVYGAPAGGLSSASQGNLQFLQNGNAFLGWGANAFFSESAADGTPALFGFFALTAALHYRAYKFNFTSIPNDQPALYTYAHNDSAPTTFYVSWNGATEVASWTFYGGVSADNLTMVGNTKKNGFETVASQPTFYQYTIAEAVAANGTGLRNSSLVSTYMPGSQLTQKCTDVQCPLVGGYQIQPNVLGLGPMPTPSGSLSSDGSAASTSSDANHQTGTSKSVGAQSRPNAVWNLVGVIMAIALMFTS